MLRVAGQRHDCAFSYRCGVFCYASMVFKFLGYVPDGVLGR